MADEATEAEWAKSKKIEEEKLKAVRALNEAEPDAKNIAYLDPEQVKVKGWSKDRQLILVKAEKLGTWATILALTGVALGVIAVVGSLVGVANRLGMASIFISGIPATISYLCFGLAVFFGIIATVSALYYRLKDGKKLGVPGWSGIGALLISAVYMLIKGFVVGL